MDKFLSAYYNAETKLIHYKVANLKRNRLYIKIHNTKIQTTTYQLKMDRRQTVRKFKASYPPKVPLESSSRVLVESSKFSNFGGRIIS